MRLQPQFDWIWIALSWQPLSAGGERGHFQSQLFCHSAQWIWLWQTCIFGLYLDSISESTLSCLDNKFLNDYATSLSPQKLVRGIDKYLIGVRMVWYGMMHPVTCWHYLSPIIYELPSRPIDIWLKPYCRWIVWKGHLHLQGSAIHAALSIIMMTRWHLLHSMGKVCTASINNLISTSPIEWRLRWHLLSAWIV